MSESFGETVTAQINKPIQIESIFPDEIEKFPWAGHLGIKLVDKVIPIIHAKHYHTYFYKHTRHE